MIKNQENIEESTWNESETHHDYSRNYAEVGNNRITDRILGFETILNLLDKHPRFQRNDDFPDRSRFYKNNVLDFGCGSGEFTSNLLIDCRTSVIAVDSSKTAVHETESKNRQWGENPGQHYHLFENYVKCRQVQNADLSFIEEFSLDAAFVNFVLCTIKDDGLIKKIMQQINDKLKPGSPFFVCDPHPSCLGKDFYSFRKEIPANLVEGAPITTWLTGMTTSLTDYWRSERRYLRLLDESGFKIDKIKVYAPLIEGREKEGYWKDERKSPPFIIFEAMK